jgi:hypothetical protein
MVHTWELNIEYKSGVNYHLEPMERNAYQQKMKHKKKTVIITSEWLLALVLFKQIR